MKNSNNWNGEFLRYKVREIAIAILFVIGLAGVCMLCSCSGAGTIRTKGGTLYGIDNAGTVYDGGNNETNSKTGSAISASPAL